MCIRDRGEVIGIHRVIGVEHDSRRIKRHTLHVNVNSAHTILSVKDTIQQSAVPLKVTCFNASVYHLLHERYRVVRDIRDGTRLSSPLGQLLDDAVDTEHGGRLQPFFGDNPDEFLVGVAYGEYGGADDFLGSLCLLYTSPS